jgi:hypothetical protein
MIYLAVTHGDVGLLALALDLAVPPLSLLVVLICTMLGITSLSAFLGSTFAPLIISAASLLGLSVAIVLSWLTFGRDVLAAAALLSVPYYVSRKSLLYWRIMTGRKTTHWTRTYR